MNPINRRSFLIVTSLTTALALAATPESKLAVRVNYDGKGTVSPSHKIYVALWDTPDFVKENSKYKPLDTKTITAKSGVVQFNKVAKNPVYVSLVYDPAGSYDGTSALQKGYFIGLYSTEQGIPTPISLKPGQTTTVTARLDDSTQVK
jgi:hypothetical protein